MLHDYLRDTLVIRYNECKSCGDRTQFVYIIINEKCHVLTNNHVVDEAQRLKVTLIDGSMFDGKVI
ncbi:MAG TPA: hypothetical protein VFJ51_04670, partial [Nitrososphaeraceae archaeon]|nr:hypothetical protein [Nitrososphaeraceae archaeon]